MSKPDRDLVVSLPKVELHAHLFGCISRATLLELAERDIMSETEISLLPATDLESCFKYFDQVYSIIRTGHRVERVMKEVFLNFAQDNVKYLELRTVTFQKSNEQGQGDC
eukprot:GHVN01055944.1.p1 GENE.GHVN01055944.1~~GHVN01055944.1.p1  ORF type:complete len:110 (+),score=0.22 GHVN01055944.1:63-392(+)